MKLDIKLVTPFVKSSLTLAKAGDYVFHNRRVVYLIGHTLAGHFVIQHEDKKLEMVKRTTKRIITKEMFYYFYQEITSGTVTVLCSDDDLDQSQFLERVQRQAPHERGGFSLIAKVRGTVTATEGEGISPPQQSAKVIPTETTFTGCTNVRFS